METKRSPPWKRDKKNAEYVIADQKSRELSEAAREIEEFFRKELVPSRDQQKKRKRNDIE